VGNAHRFRPEMTSKHLRVEEFRAQEMYVWSANVHLYVWSANIHLYFWSANDQRCAMITGGQNVRYATRRLKVIFNGFVAGIGTHNSVYFVLD